MKMLAPIIFFALTTVLLSGAADAQNRGSNDTTEPTFTLTMNDGKNAGPIIWHEPGVFPPPLDLPKGAVARPSALGCNGSYHENGWDPGWSEIYDTDFFSPWVQGQTYFFRELRDGPLLSDFVPYSFTLRASDTSGIKKILVKVRERDVVHSWSNPSIVVDDGPSDFINVSPSRAVPRLLPIYYNTSSPFFQHYEKQLLFEPRFIRVGSSDYVLHFDLTDFGVDARISVDVEDNAGNVSSGGVFVADDRLCFEPVS